MPEWAEWPVLRQSFQRGWHDAHGTSGVRWCDTALALVAVLIVLRDPLEPVDGDGVGEATHGRDAEPCARERTGCRRSRSRGPALWRSRTAT